MCGITGIFAFNLVGKFNKIHITQATQALSKRGPDYQDIYLEEWVCLGHRRLSILDTTAVAHQPMWDESKRYCIVFNGEIFNFRELREDLMTRGVSFFSSGDTEVLLKLYILEGEKCLNKLNGFFSFCIYDKQEQAMFLARDRFGIKPLLYVLDEDKFIFASEMKAILQMGIDRHLDYVSLYTYLQLNYTPAPHTIFTTVKKLMPGHYMRVSRRETEIKPYYSIPYHAAEVSKQTLRYEDAQQKFRELLDESVQRRLVSDVPIGSFLSGGVDSSVITALARRHKSDLHTFSIGFRDEKFFDETHYASLVAKHLGTEHTIFSLTNDDLFAHVHDILEYIDEPFADSSAIAVYILSKETRKHVTVALSGDGADEMLGGYNKHAALYRALHRGPKENIIGLFGPLWKMLPQSRNNSLTNKVRQLARFSEGLKMSNKDRYWRWAIFTGKEDALQMLQPGLRFNTWLEEFEPRREELLRHISPEASMNDYLLSDMQLVLPNDMLTKVDLMSMANSLEVRVPFLDYKVVNFVFSLPDEFKINGSMRKRILQDSCRDLLPAELYNRPKKGFEVPLLKWFRREMKSLIMDDLLSDNFIKEQNIFDEEAIRKLKVQLFSSNPQDVHAKIWALIVFQSWWKRWGRP
jgi:asparagine synthase (glutamine-hydrolysing)